VKWYKRDANESRKSHVIELYQRHGFKGLFFWSRLNDLLAEYFNFWCPGCYKFKTSIFYAFFMPEIQDPRTIRKMLSFLHGDKILNVSIGKSELYLHYPDIIERADVYTKRCLKKAEDSKQEQPESARDLAFWCNEMQKYSTKDMRRVAKEFIENKGVKH
jgi:hypothetical protein